MWGQYKIEFANRLNEYKVKIIKEKLKGYKEDKKIIDRRASQECKACTYFDIDKAHLQAFTTVNCGNCGKEMIFATSDTYKLCLPCSRELGICAKCGGTMD